MDELWRVMADGGTLDVEVPRMPHSDAYNDPTHVRYFTPVTFDYFSPGYGQRFQMPCKPWVQTEKHATDSRIFVKMMPDRPKKSVVAGLTSIIIPCYILPDRNAELRVFTQECINALRQHTTNFELVIVDNGSPIDAQWLESEADIYIRNETNLGYPPAINQGFRAATGEWLVAMNNDVTVTEDWLELMQAAWDSSVGAVSSHLISKSDSPPTGERKALTQEAHWGTMFGSLWITRREVVEKVGYLDEEYERGMYDDKDLWMRLSENGYKLMKAGWCWHIGNATWGKLPNQKRIFFKNKERFETKWQAQLQTS